MDRSRSVWCRSRPVHRVCPRHSAASVQAVSPRGAASVNRGGLGSRLLRSGAPSALAPDHASTVSPRAFTSAQPEGTSRTSPSSTVGSCARRSTGVACTPKRGFTATLQHGETATPGHIPGHSSGPWTCQGNSRAMAWGPNSRAIRRWRPTLCPKLCPSSWRWERVEVVLCLGFAAEGGGLKNRSIRPLAQS